MDPLFLINQTVLREFWAGLIGNSHANGDLVFSLMGFGIMVMAVCLCVILVDAPATE